MSASLNATLKYEHLPLLVGEAGNTEAAGGPPPLWNWSDEAEFGSEEVS